MQKEESKNIVFLDQQAEDIISLLEHLSPTMITHDGASCARQYYESMKKKKGRAVAIGSLKILLMNLQESIKKVESEFSEKIQKDEICAEKKKSPKSRSQK